MIRPSLSTADLPTACARQDAAVGLSGGAALRVHSLVSCPCGRSPLTTGAWDEWSFREGQIITRSERP